MPNEHARSLDPALEGLEPTSLWTIFNEIKEIPRPSGQETAVIDFLATFAGSHGFESKKDAHGNLCIHVPATKGYEDRPPLCLQGHADMVCVKDDGIDHDFDKDPIKLQRTDGMLKAHGTTLGSDNGVGLAAALALATDPDAIHPALEILVTRQEEIGLIGAENLDPKELGMQSQKILNLDTEESGSTYVSSAGFAALKSNLKLERKNSDGTEANKSQYLEITLAGMKGGHSGVDIDKKRGNALMIMGNLLQTLPQEVGLISIDGGQAMNAIPAQAKAVVLLPESIDKAQITSAVETFSLSLDQSWGAKFETTEKSAAEVKTAVISADTHSQILQALTTIPNGVHAMSPAVDGLVQTSSNLGVIKTTDDAVNLDLSVRSDVSSEMDGIAEKIGTVLGELKFETTMPLKVPGWQGKSDTSVVKAVQDAHQRVTGNTATIKGVHGGLETGFIINKLQAASGGKEIEAVSFGPTIVGAHSPSEAIKIDTVSTFYAQLKDAVRTLAS